MGKRLILGLLVACVVAFAGPIPDALTPYTMLDLSGGQTVGTGTVDTGHVIFGFNAIEGRTLDLRVNVTEILPSFYDDDDSKLFLFDADGHLLASDDDSGPSLQSWIANYVLPFSGLYFAAVTTYPNDPVMSGGVITGWQDDGLSAFNFELQASQVPEPATFAMIGIGAIALGIVRRFRR